ncbi:UNVERIFIED_CONTAM: hypothetical protein Sradi_2955700 [Sesamum radiatum]|uniref:CCHC-type domain-containing protein n=1 Tax=Sesamum radiatum TaxID=300843 RepID=A0AAW2RZS1_SESRA
MGDDHLVTFTYERLPNLCYLCGCLGHLSRFCEKQLEEGFIDPGDNMPSGPWLRAAPPFNSKYRIHASPYQTSTRHKTRPTFVMDTTYRHATERDTPRGTEVFGNYHRAPLEQAIHKESSLNPMGIGAPWTVRALKDMVHSLNPDLVFLMETKITTQKIDSLKRSLDMHRICVNSVGRSGGLALLWRRSVMVTIQSYSPCHIDATVQDPNQPPLWRFSGIYGESDASKHKITWSLLSKLHSQSRRPWICIGDFNEILDNSEKEGGNLRPNWQIRDFRNALNVDELFYLGYSGDPFTWCNRQEEPHTIRERLDRACASNDWIQLYTNSTLQHLSTVYSDHVPFLLNLSPTHHATERRRKPFWFEAAWTGNADCDRIIERNWSRSNGLLMGNSFVERLHQCREELKFWNVKMKGKSF